MRPEFSAWLASNKNHSLGTQSSRTSNIKKIEEHYGNLEDHFSKGTYPSIIQSLTYSTTDERLGKPNPSKIIFEGNIRNNLNMYKSAAILYRSFLSEQNNLQGEYNSGFSPSEPIDNLSSFEETIAQKLSLERDMQQALRRNIASLDPSLIIIDDGAERAVDSGFIDILCEDSNSMVVIELKAGKANDRAIAQILGYMGDLMEEEGEEGKPVRGVLVAHDFDTRARSAARAVTNLTLKRYNITFNFTSD